VTEDTGSAVGLFGVPRRTGTGWSWVEYTNMWFFAASNSDAVHLDQCYNPATALGYTGSLHCDVDGSQTILFPRPADMEQHNGMTMARAPSGPNKGIWYIASIWSEINVRHLVGKRYRNADSTRYFVPSDTSPGAPNLRKYCGNSTKSVYEAMHLFPCATDPLHYFGGVLDSIVIPHEVEHMRLIKKQAMSDSGNLRALAEPMVSTDSADLVNQVYQSAFAVDRALFDSSYALHAVTAQTGIMSRSFSSWYFVANTWQEFTGTIAIHKNN